MLLKLNFKHVILMSALMLLGSLSMTSIILAQSGTWTQMKGMPTARWALSTSAVDGKIYAFGGFATDHRLDTVEMYDYVTNTWTTTLQPLPGGPCFGMSTSAVNGKIYIIGGSIQPLSSCNMVYEYDPVTESYTRKQDMPTPRVYLSTSVVNGKIYVFGGAASITSTTISGFYATVEEYDPSTNTWTSKTSMPGGARCALSTNVVNGKIYAIGGYKSGDVVISTVEEYDPATDTWITKIPMPTPRGWLSTSVVNGKIYAIGGIRDHISLSTVEVYDPATDIWDTTKTDMPTERCAFSTSEVDGEIYAIGGQINFSGPPWDPGLKTVEKFDPLATSVKNINMIQNNPTKFLLHQNYPNPFNATTTISYSIAKSSQVKITVYNTLGQVVAVLVNGFQEQGTYSIAWDAGNQPSGLYLCRFEADGFTATKKMFLQK